MSKLPAFQFYPADWKNDLGVQAMSYFDRGVWFEILCLMHNSEQRGRLILNGKPMSNDALAGLLGLDNQILTKTLNLLLEYGVASRDEEGCLINRRMIRDENLRQIRANAGKLGGNPNLVNQNSTKTKKEDNHIPNQTPKQIPTPSSSSSIAFKKELPSVVPKKADTEEAKPIKKPPSRGSRIPDDFRVTDAMSRWAAAETPGVSIAFETKQFTDYYRAAPNSKGIKLDWTATWRTWMRNAYTGFGDRVKKPVDTFPKHIPDEADKPFDCLNCADDGFTIGSYNKTLDTWPKIPCPKCERGKTWKPEADPDTG